MTDAATALSVCRQALATQSHRNGLDDQALKMATEALSSPPMTDAQLADLVRRLRAMRILTDEAITQLHADCSEAATAITELQAALRAKWLPIESAPMDKQVLLGWWYQPFPTTLAEWEMEAGLAGHANDCGPNASNGWLHGQAQYWQPLPSPPEQK